MKETGQKSRAELIEEVEALRRKVTELEAFHIAGKQAVEALEAFNRQIRHSIDSMPEGYILWDLEYRIFEWNRAAEIILGYTKESMEGKYGLDIIFDSRNRPEALTVMEKVKTGSLDSHSATYTIINNVDAEVICQWYCIPLRTLEGNVFGILTMLRDITGEQKMAQELKQQNSFLHSVIESLTHPFYVVNANDYTVVLANSMAGEIVRKGKTTCFSLTYGLDAPCQFEDHPCPVEIIKKTKIPYKGEYVHFTEDGKRIASEIYGYPIFNSEGEVDKIIEYSLDITDRKVNEEERRRLEEQLRHVQKMEAIGSLAGGIAHDFNNVLGAIIGYTELAAVDVEENSMTAQNLQQVLVAADRAKQMVKQILAFSRKDEEMRKPLVLNRLVSETVKLLRSTLPSTIEISVIIKKEPKPVMADSTQVHQVIMNLCTNAAHAMRQNGGLLELSLDQVERGYEAIEGGPLAPGIYACLGIRDTGHGIPADILDRVFEPYFTTKKTGEGTGMGLAVAHGIIKSHRGEIRVLSEPGKGTQFKVYLPITQNEIQKNAKKNETIRGGNERILFVDDEKSLVKVGIQMLEMLGYKVEGKVGSQEALETFQADPYQFDLVITDQTMPRMTGSKLSGELKKIRPEIPIILCTGFSENVNEENFRSKGGDAFLQKPIVKHELDRMIRSLLD
jgi:PAS domain S-box-containing protein